MTVRTQGPDDGGAARRILRALLPEDDWSQAFVAELDAELSRLREQGSVSRAGWWYARQLLSPQTLHFVTMVRRRRRARGGSPLAGLGADLRQASRSLAREPRVSLVVIVTLALGIGSVASIYEVSERLFLSGPSHVRAPEELARLYLRFEDPAGPRVAPWIPYLTALALQREARSLSDLTLYRRQEALVRVGERALPLQVVESDGRFFGVLGVLPEAGRFFGAEAAADAGTSAVLAHALAVSAFGSAEAALGRPVEMASGTYSVVGVAPEGFAGPHLERVDVWIPMDADGAGNRNWWVVGRIPGASRNHEAFAGAAAEAEGIHRQTDPGRFYGWARDGRVTLADVRADDAGGTSPETAIARLLLAMVSLLLLIAGANVINLLLARMTRRADEIVVRMALGISRYRLARATVAESLLLGVAAGLLSLPVAYIGGAVLRRELLPQVAWTSSPVDLGTVLWAGAAALLVGVAVGLIPAMQAGRTDLRSRLGSGRSSRTLGRARTQAVLATGQVALSAALLMSAGLFLKSFWTIRVTDLGLAENAVSVRLRSLEAGPIEEGTEGESALYARALAAAREIPGAERSALTVGLPFLYGFGLSVFVPGLDSVPELPGGGPYYSAVSGGYFEAVGTPVLRGLPIMEEHATARERVVVVSESMAAALWPARDPLGACVRLGDAAGECWQVIGVAVDVHRQGYREPPSMQFYVPLGHDSALGGTSFGGMALVVRPTQNAAGVMERVEAVLEDLDPAVDHVELVTLEAVLDPQIRPWRLGAVVLSLTALLAVVVSLLGVYGVLAHLLAQRRQEIGVRLALGATGGNVRALLFRSGLLATGVGLAAGVALMLSTSRWLGPLLFETSVADPLVIGGVAGLLLAGAVLACAPPALQAARVDPLTCLRDR